VVDGEKLGVDSRDKWKHAARKSHHCKPVKVLNYLGTSKSLPDQPRPLCILSKKWGLAATDVPLWQMPNNVTYCQQLPTDQTGGWAAAFALS